MIINSNLSYTLNFLRWFAAFLVVINHLRSLMFVDYYEVIEKTIFTKLFYFFTGFGHESVIVFFILSGFLVGGEFIKYPKTNKYFKIYFVKRFSRIFIVFIPALIIGCTFDLIGSNYFNFNNIYSNSYHLSAMNYEVTERIGIIPFITNLLMLQTSLGDTLGSNGPLWSLANEWWYYVLFPVIYLILFHKSNLLKVSLIIFVICMLLILNNYIFLYFLIWILGTYIYKYNTNIKFPFINLFSFLLLILSFSISRINLLDSVILSDFLIALTLVFFINNLINSESKIIFLGKKNSFLADFSYSVYLFHFPVLLLIVSILSYFEMGVKSIPNITSYGIFGILIIFVYLFSFIMYLIFEKNTRKLKDWIINCLD